MSKTLAALVLAIVAAPAASALPIYFTPALPQSDEQILVRYSGVCSSSCTPGQPSVSVAGRIVTIRQPILAGALTVIEAWEKSTRLGPLAPGSYLVRVIVESDSFATQLKERELIVVEADAPIRVRPFAARSGESITLVAAPRTAIASCSISVCTPAEVRVGGVPVVDARATSFNAVHARLPALTPGLYDVTVSFSGRETRLQAAVRIFSEGDDTLFERVLVPATLRAAGAQGSEWRTDVFVRNPTAHRIPLLGIGDIDSGALRTLAERFPNDDHGVYLRIDRASAPSAALAGFVRDVSRDGSRWGVEMPLVRESELHLYDIDFAAVPIDRNARAMLRIYGVDITAGTYAVQIVGDDNQVLALNFLAATTADKTRPAFAALNLTSLGIGDQVVGIRVYPANGGEEALFAPFWAFVTVTHNETQHVTLITPQ